MILGNTVFSCVCRLSCNTMQREGLLALQNSLTALSSLHTLEWARTHARTQASTYTHIYTHTLVIDSASYWKWNYWLSPFSIRNNGLSVQVIEDLVKQLRCVHVQRYIRWGGYGNSICVWDLLCECVWFRLCVFPISIEETWITAEAAVNLVSCCLNLNHNIHTIRWEFMLALG